MERTPNEKIIIFGGNLIAGYLASKLEQDDNIQSVKIIDEDEESARFLADTLKDAVVIHGEMMSDVILTEAGIQSADAAIAVTSHDKDNLLASLLAKKSGVSSAISLVNSRAYDNLIDNVADNILIDRSSVTISSILQELRKAKLSDAYSLGRGFGELWEIRCRCRQSYCRPYGCRGRFAQDQHDRRRLPRRNRYLSVFIRKD